MSQAASRFTPLSEPAQVFVILVSYNTAGLLQRCIDHLRAASDGLRVSVVVVDNASRDGSAARIKREFTDCTLIENTVNVGFGRANNQALALCNAPFVLLLNTDAYMAEDTLRQSLRHMEQQPDCGVLGARLVDEQGNGNASARDFPSAWRSFALKTGLSRYRGDDRARAKGASFVDCDWVTGCYYLARRVVLDQVGLFDPRYFLYFEEVDHCRAVRQAGWKVQCLLSTTVIHVGGASAQSDGELTSSGNQLLSLQIESELLYFRKHGGAWGMSTALALAFIGEGIVALKGLLRGRGRQQIASQLQNLRERWRLLIATQGGVRPTR